VPICISGWLNNLASVLRDQDRYAEAKQMYWEVVEVRERVLDTEHPSILTNINNLAFTGRDKANAWKPHTRWSNT
jgi:hypothetical protein